MALRADTIQLNDTPIELVLKYETGRQTSVGNILYTTHQGSLFLRPADASKIDDLNLRPNEPFKIWKEGKEVRVAKVNVQLQRRDGHPAAATTTTAQGFESPAQQQSPSKGTSLAHDLASAYISAIDALVVAKEYARSKGMDIRISEEEIRTSAHCVFIEYGRTKDRELRFKADLIRTQARNGNGGASWQQ